MRKLFLTAASVALLSGCGSTHPADDKAADAALTAIDAYGQRVQKQSDQTNLVELDAPYTTSRKIKRSKENKLPVKVRDTVFGLGSAGAFTLEQVASRITARTGIQVRIIRGDMPGSSGGGSASPDLPPSSAQLAALNFANGQAGASGGGAGSYSGSTGATFVPNLEEKLPDALNDLADRFDFDWNVDPSGTIVINTVVQEVFSVPLNPPKILMSNTVTGATDGSSPTAGNTSQDSGLTISLDPWQTFEQTAKQIVGGKGFAIADRSQGFLVVRTSPRTMKEVHQWYDPLQQSMLARVAVDVTFIYVDITDSTNFGFNLNAAFTSLKGPLKGISTGFTGLAPSIVSAPGSETVSIVNAPVGSDLSQFNGTTAVLSALASTKRLVDWTTYTAVAQNSIPNTMAFTTKQDYLKNVSFNTTGLSGTSSTSTDVETLNYGSAIQILPRIISKDQMTLLVGLTSAPTPVLTPFSANNNTQIQLQTSDHRALQPSLVLASGETQIVAGYDYTATSINDQGVGQSNFLGLGGTQGGSTRRIRLYLAIHAGLVPSGQPYNYAKAE